MFCKGVQGVSSIMLPPRVHNSSVPAHPEKVVLILDQQVSQLLSLPGRLLRSRVLKRRQMQHQARTP